jgi:hypothetical protein
MNRRRNAWPLFLGWDPRVSLIVSGIILGIYYFAAWLESVQ